MFKTLEKIQKLLKDEFGSQIKQIFLDDPNLIPMSALPCIAVAPVSTDIAVLDTGRDQYTYTIDIFLIIDALKEIKKFAKEIVGTRYLCTIMESRDSSGNLKDHTVLSILRSNLTLGDNWYIGNVGKVDYGLRIRPEQGVTKEASCRLTVLRITNR